MTNGLVFSLTLFCFLPLIISTFAFGISIFNFIILKKIKIKCNIIDDNVVELMRLQRQKYYEKKQDF